MRVPATANPSIAMKCMAQIAVPPSAHAASRPHQTRWPPLVAVRIRPAQTSPSAEPSTDNA